MSKTVCIFHGYGGYRESSWLSWLNSQLVDQGIPTIYPSFPFMGTSTIDDWYQEFSKYENKLHQPISIVGHSGGNTFAFHVVQKLDLQFEKLVLVAPLNDRTGANNSLTNRPGKELERPYLINFIHQHFDYDLIKSRVKEFVFYLSDNDPVIQYKETKAYFQNIFPNSKFVTLPNYGHVNEKAGITKLPEVLEEVYADLGY